jgi:hypothetical protein
MAFPTIKPTSRNFNAGDWPVKIFRTQAGTESRILYGNQRSGQTLELSYQNITDATAELFLDHYNEVRGTYGTFGLGDIAAGQGARSGWSGNYDALGAGASGASYRYEEPPRVEAVKPGISNVSIKLIAVL